MRLTSGSRLGHCEIVSPRDPMEWLFYDAISGAYFNANHFDEGGEAGRKLITLRPDYYFGYIWTAMNEVGRGNLDAGRAAVREARRLVPDLSLEMVRRVIGGMSPDVDRRMMGALGQACLE